MLLHRWLLGTASGLLMAVGLIVGLGWALPASQEEIKKVEKKGTQPAQENPKEGELQKKLAPEKAKQPEKSGAEKEIDDLVKEMTRNLSATDPAILKQIRENVRNMPAEQRKQMLAMMRNQRFSPTPAAALPAAAPVYPGFFGAGHEVRLGVRVEPPSPTLVEQLDLPKDQGLVVQEVLPDSAAAKAGLKRHDILLEFNGKAVPNRVEGLVRLLADIKPDTEVEAVVLRKGKKETIAHLKLPEAKTPPFGFPPTVVHQPPPAFPQPLGAGGTVLTTLTRTKDHITLRHQEGSLIITLTGPIAEGKAKIREIHVQDGIRSEQYSSVDKVPEQYRDKVKNLIDMSEKSSVSIEIKSP